MIDFFKIRIHDKIEFEKLIEKDKFKFKAIYDSSNKRINDYPKYYRSENLQIKILRTHALLDGSIHKFNNIIHQNEDQNYNQLTYSDLNEIIPALEDEYFLRNNNNVIKLEIGFNIVTESDPSKIIENQILLHDYEEPTRNIKFGNKGRLKAFKTSQIELKIYDKGKQSNLLNNVIRIELKLLRTRKLTANNVFQLNDLLKLKNLVGLFETFEKEFSKLLVIDENWESKIKNEKDLNLVRDAISSYYWKKFDKQHTWGQKKRKMNKIHKVLSKYNINSTYNHLLNNIDFQFVAFMEKIEEMDNADISYISLLKK